MAKHGGLTQFAQSLIEYMEDLITASPKESFSKIEMLVLFNAIKNDREMLAMMEAAGRRLRTSSYNG
jgi:hypothetical protein